MPKSNKHKPKPSEVTEPALNVPSVLDLLRDRLSRLGAFAQLQPEDRNDAESFVIASYWGLAQGTTPKDYADARLIATEPGFRTTWLNRRTIDWIRHRSSKLGKESSLHTESVEALPTGDRPVEEFEAWMNLRLAYESLEPDEQTLLVALISGHLRGQSDREVAEGIRVSPSTFSDRKKALLSKIRGLLAGGFEPKSQI